MNKKEFMIGDHKFVINYFEDLSKLNSYYDNKAIEVIFNPTELISESEANKIVDDNADAILLEFKKVIEEHPEVYKHFDYEFDFAVRGSSQGIVNNNLYLISMELRIFMKLKKGIV